MNAKMIFGDIYRGHRVLVTGHHGFKGAWLSLWLKTLGAEVHGIGIPNSESFLYGQIRDDTFKTDRSIDVASIDFGYAVKELNPGIIFHLAAESLVKECFDRPLDAFKTNIMGTVNLLEAVREMKEQVCVVLVTSDKVYYPHLIEPLNEPWNESDLLWSDSPYGASKVGAELVAHTYWQSYFKDEGRVKLAVARAGNVIGGGDYAPSRIVPDAIRAAIDKKPLQLRHPWYIRPWQHVFDCLAGYLTLGQRLLEGSSKALGEAFNFGPPAGKAHSVYDLAIEVSKNVPLKVGLQSDIHAFPETATLELNSEKAARDLGWFRLYPFQLAVKKTCDWYKARHFQNCDMHAVSLSQLQEYSNFGADRL